MERSDKKTFSVHNKETSTTLKSAVFTSPRKADVCVIKTDGINCDEEMMEAFRIVGANPKLVHVNDLRDGYERFERYQILALPGGFSYGDDIVSGKVLAIELISYLGDQLSDFVEKKSGIVFGVCNGFQVLVRTGLLPFKNLGKMDSTLAHNDSGRFECRWINLKKKGTDEILSLPVAHGEGKFFMESELAEKISDQIFLQYCDEKGEITMNYPQNPNGSMRSIAGITDSTGRIVGIMPHPERFIYKYQHPNWRRGDFGKPHGVVFFEDLIKKI